MKRVSSTLIALFIILSCREAFARTLSDSARISLLTCSPGEELYSAFGHNGIRITDYKNEFDVVFNYGTFDFNQPGFYTNFIKGKMLYMVSTDRFSDFMDEYTYEKRSVTEIELNLTTEDKQRIFAYLYNNALPENREYYYDFFWDNCATRPRDVFEKTLDNRLQYHTEHAGFRENYTMRNMLHAYVYNRPWIDYGFDLILGLPCDVFATPRNQTFLPFYLEKYFECATIDGQPFVVKKQTLLSFPPPVITSPFRPLHLSLLLVITGFIIWFVERKKKIHFYQFDFIIYLLTGLLGSLFMCLWIFSSHYSVPKNMNLLWLIPSHLVVSFFLLKKNKPFWLKFYFAATYILMMIVLLSWHWLPQPLSIAAMPLVFLLAARSASIAIDLHFKNKL
ncbi:MAG: DUF4105 domain-containing protein [Chitinophagales bacterium]